MVKLKIKTEQVVAFTVLFSVILMTSIYFKNNSDKSCRKGFELLNQQLKCSNPVISKSGYTQFKKDLTNKITNLIENGEVESVSVFFRDLENGPTFSINDQDKFIPASLLKLPVLITYFEIAEDNPEILSKQILNNISINGIYQTIDPTKVMHEGEVYTVDDLLFRMIAYSDNSAMFILTQYLKAYSPDKNLLNETYVDLGLVTAGFDNIEAETLTPKTYASIFRLLYNSSYLSNKYSEKALEYLSNSDYVDGLRNGVPEGIKISQKFGERWLSDSRTQLHDCGIIYYPKNPYLLCVMTRGSDRKKLAEVISTISSDVYKEIDSRKQ